MVYQKIKPPFKMQLLVAFVKNVIENKFDKYANCLGIAGHNSVHLS